MAHHARHRRGSASTAQAVAQGLGWFSIGLGLAQILAPRRLAGPLGMRGHEGLIRVYGLREVVTGVGILAQDDPTPWLWARVAGDALDLGTLAATGLDADDRHQRNIELAMAAVAGVTVLDVMCAQTLAAERRRAERPVPDYSGRSGLPRPPEQMRGAARDFEVPEDFRIPEPLRPWTGGDAAAPAG